MIITQIRDALLPKLGTHCRTNGTLIITQIRDDYWPIPLFGKYYYLCGNFIEVTLLGTVHPNRDLLKESELVLQGYYKPLLSLGKNSYGLLKVGPNVGFGSIGVLFGAGVGFEYGVVFKSGLKFFIAQDNLLVFRGDDRFSSGVSAGIRIPL